MSIRYNLTLDDYVAFTDHHYQQAPSQRTQRSRMKWGCFTTAFMLMLLTLAVDMSRGVISLWPVILLCIAVSALLFTNRYFQNAIRRQARRLYADGSGRGTLGDHELEIHADGIVDRTHYSEIKAYWRGIDRVEENPDYVFVYIGSMQAIIIPRRCTDGPSLQQVLQRINVERTKAPPSAPPTK